VKELLPKTIMMENVPGLVDNWRFKKFCTELRKLGYVLNYDVKNAADYGVPQRRKRMILLAGLKQKIEFAEPTERKTVKDFIKGLPKAGKSGDPLHDMPERRSAKVKRFIAKIPKDGGSRTDLPKKDQLKCHKCCERISLIILLNHDQLHMSC